MRATAALYQPSVSHRIGEIQTITTAQEWRFVPGPLNPTPVKSPDDLPSLLKPDGRGIELIRRCQEEVYVDELERLRRGQFLRSSSSLLPLSPILGADGLSVLAVGPAVLRCHTTTCISQFRRVATRWRGS